MSKSKGPKCAKCGRKLTDPYSIAVGMGPECRGGAVKKGTKLPKPRYRVRNGRVEFLGLTSAEPLPVNVDETMSQTWVKKTTDDAAHLVKLYGPTYFTAACGEIVPRGTSLQVRLKRIELAYHPWFRYVPDADQVCSKCKMKAV